MAETVKTPTFRVSFPAVFEAKSFNGNDPMYSIVMLFDKKTDIKALKALAQKAVEAKWPDKAKRPKGLKSPFRDGDVEKPDMDGYSGCIFISAKSKKKPGVLDTDGQTVLTSDDDFYAGCFAKAVLTAYAYDVSGNRGIAFGLQHVKKMADGDEFSGRVKLEDAFDESDTAEEFNAPAAKGKAKIEEEDLEF